MTAAVELVEPAVLGEADGCRVLHASKGTAFTADVRILDGVPHWEVPDSFESWPSYVLEMRDALVTPRFLPVTASRKLVSFGAAHNRIVADVADWASALYPEIVAIDGVRVEMNETEPADEIPGTVVLCAGGGESANHFHFMMDYLPRLLLARSLGHAEGARVLLDGRAGPAGHEYLAALGLGPDELIVKPADRAVRVERLIVPSFLSRTGCVYPPAVELLRRFFQPVVPAPGRRRIYISRRGWRQRRLENEAEIEGALAERGFEIAAPERMTMADQIGLFSAAAIVAMPHGGALANMIFAPPGSQIVEIMTKFQPAGISIAGHCGQTHWHVKPEPVDDARDAFRQPLSPFLQLIDAASASQSRGP